MRVLAVQNLTKRYRGLDVVDHVNFTLSGGEVTGYLGPNGSGKSTTVKMLTCSPTPRTLRWWET